MQMAKGLGGLRSQQENTMRKREGGVLVFQGRVLEWVCGKF